MATKNNTPTEWDRLKKKYGVVSHEKKQDSSRDEGAESAWESLRSKYGVGSDAGTTAAKPNQSNPITPPSATITPMSQGMGVASFGKQMMGQTPSAVLGGEVNPGFMTSGEIRTAHGKAVEELDTAKADHERMKLEWIEQSQGGTTEQQRQEWHPKLEAAKQKQKEAEAKVGKMAGAYYTARGEELSRQMNREWLDYMANLAMAVQDSVDKMRYGGEVGPDWSFLFGGKGDNGINVSAMNQLEEAKKHLESLGWKREDIDRMVEYQVYVRREQAAQAKKEAMQKKLEETEEKYTYRGGYGPDYGYLFGRESQNGVVTKQVPKDKGIDETAAAIMMAPAQAFDFINMRISTSGRNNTGNIDTYKPASVADMPATVYANAVTGTIAKRIEGEKPTLISKAAAFLYQTGMSMAQSTALAAGLGPFSLAVMGGSAAANTALDVIERGGTNNQAFAAGIASGVAEVLFEKFSVENLLKGVGDSTFFKSVLKQAGIEASEEMATEIANILSDAVIMGRDSRFEESVRAYMDEGMSREQAEQKAFLDCVGQVAMAGLGGALSGGGSMAMMGGAQTILGQAAQEMAQNGSISNNTAERIMADPTAMEQLGVDTSGMTKSQTRNAVKDAVAGQTPAQETASATTAPVQQTAPQKASESETAHRIQQGERASAALGENGARAFKAAYDETTAATLSAEDAYSGFARVYNAALKGETVESDLPAHMKLAAEAAAQKDALRAEQAAYFGEKSGVVRDDNFKKAHLSSRTVRTLDAVAKVAGVQVRFAEDVKDSGGVSVNASYGNGVITVSLKSDQPVRAVFTHEIIHRIRETAPAAYSAMADFVRNNMSKTVQGVLGKLYGETYETTSVSEYTEEMIADAFGTMLGDSKVMEQFVQDNRTAAEKLRDVIVDLINAVKRALNGQNVKLDDMQRKAFMELSRDLEGMEKVLSGALKSAKDDRAAFASAEVSDETVRNLETGKPVSAVDEVKLSRKFDSKYMDAAEKKNNGRVKKEVMAEARRVRQAVADIFNDPDLADSLGLPPDIIGNTYIPNGSYSGTEENSTVCIRSIAADALMDAVAEYLGRPLTVEDTVAISQEYWKYTDKPECLYCYVAMDRKAHREFLGSYLKQRDETLENIRNGMSREEAYEKFRDGRKDTDPMKKRFDMWLRNDGKDMITAKDLASYANMEAAMERNPALKEQINDALKYAQSASWAKKRLSYAAYNNHILKWKQSRIDNLNSNYGLRMYSFSDFSPAFILENMQMITDAAVRGLKVLAYTKELDFVRIFAKTGMNINISVFGYDAASGVGMDAMQGADWAEAYSLRRENPNVGITFVATNDSQIEWALEQDWIDVVIPFHLVRTGNRVASYFGWKNYTAMSSDTKKSGWTSEDAKHILPPEHQNDKDRYLAACEANNLTPRFAEWVDHPNYMKLVNETRQSEGQTQPVQPIFDLDAAKASIEEMRKRGGYYTPIGGSEENMRDIAGEIGEKIGGKTVAPGPAEGYNGVKASRTVNWKTDLTESQFMDLLSWVKHDIKTSENSITETANWTFRKFNGLPVFAIYSTNHPDSPTIMYEVKGAQAEFENQLILDWLGGNNSGAYGTAAGFAAKIGSYGSKQGGTPVYRSGNAHRGNAAGAGPLDGRTRRRKPSAAFVNCVWNILQGGTDGSVSDSVYSRSIDPTKLREAAEKVDALNRQYGTIPAGENPAREVSVPRRTSDDKKVSQTVRTIMEAGVTPDEALPNIEQMIADEEFSYEVYGDDKAVSEADGFVRNLGWEAAQREWFSEMGKGVVSKRNTTLGWMLYNNAVNSGKTALAMDILNEMVKSQRNAAQALQATRILKKLSPETQLFGVQRSVANLIEDLKKRYGDKAPNLTIDQDMAERFLRAKTDKERAEAMQEIYRDIGRQMPSTFMDKFNAWRYLAMLGNTRTHVRNIMGNLGFAPVVAFKNLTAAGIERLVLRQGRTKSVAFATKEGRALLKAAWDDYTVVADSMPEGKYSDLKNANKYIEEGRVIFTSKLGRATVERARRFNSKALSAEDAWFSRPHYASALAQYCKTNGISVEAVQKGKGTRLDIARQYAMKEAQKATYQDANKFSDAFSRLGRKSNSKWSMLLVEGVLPFRKTPANILVRSVEYSPLRFLKTLSWDIAQVSKGNMTAAEMIDGIASGLTGSALLLLGGWMAAAGLVRGHGDDEKEKEKNFSELQGHQAYALELPNGTSVTLDWLAPEALPFFIGVNFWEMTSGMKDAPKMEDFVLAFSNVSEPLLEMSCLQGLNSLLDAVGDIRSGGMAAVPMALVTASTDLLLQLFPTLFGQIERTGEDVRMTTYTDKNKWLDSNTQYFLGKLTSKIPGIDYGQIPYIDAWGRTEVSGGPFERAFNNFLNPAYMSEVNVSEMEKELERLYKATGETVVLPSRAAKSFTVNGEEINLTGEQYVEYATYRGQRAYQLITELTECRFYSALSDAEKQKAVEKCYEVANEEAKSMISEFELGIFHKHLADAEAVGISNAEYIVFYKTVNSIKGEDRAQKIRNWLKNSGFTRQQKEFLWSTEYKGAY